MLQQVGGAKGGTAAEAGPYTHRDTIVATQRL